MEVTALDGRTVVVRRQWFPWRLRRRNIDLSDGDPFSLMDGGDGLEGIVFGLVLGLVLVLFGGIILTVALFASELILLLLLLAPLFALARLFWVLPWIIEATHDGTVLGLARVRGWRDSSERIRDIAEAYQRGQDPFATTAA